ncbi:MAG: alpha/beta hydrolase, partial [Candidatus Rokuibacteriota bacterium]
ITDCRAAGPWSRLCPGKKWADEITPGLVVGDPVYLEGRAWHGGPSRLGLDWGTLRGALADHGYTTLSVQMPVLTSEAGAEEYPSTFDEAGDRLKVAVDFLRTKGYQKLGIVSHSMGSRMTHYYLTRDPGTPTNAWICIGWGGEDDVSQLPLPVLDLYGEKDLPAVLQGAKRRAASIHSSNRSQQIMAPKADHFFTNQQAELVKYVREFLDKLF